MRPWAVALSIVAAAACAWWLAGGLDDETIEDRLVGGAVDVAVDATSQLIAERLRARAESDLVEANAKLIESEAALAAERARTAELEAQRAAWEESERLFRVETESLRGRLGILWEQIDGLHSQIDVDARACVPRVAAIYDWLRDGAAGGVGGGPGAGMPEGGGSAGPADARAAPPDRR